MSLITGLKNSPKCSCSAGMFAFTSALSMSRVLWLASTTKPAAVTLKKGSSTLKSKFLLIRIYFNRLFFFQHYHRDFLKE